MFNTTPHSDYDSCAKEYNAYRRPGRELLRRLRAAFAGGEKAVLSIGCGSGRYEKTLSRYVSVIGLDLSHGMLRLARKRISRVVQGNMLHLPFPDDCFSGAYFIQSLPQLGASLSISPEERVQVRKKALQEAIRVIDTGTLLIVQRDPLQDRVIWFWEYFPQAIERKLTIQTRITTIVNWLKRLGLRRVIATPIRDPMITGFYDPESPLKSGFRHAFSEFNYLSEQEYEQGAARLKKAISDGSVQEVIGKNKEMFAKIGGALFLISAKKEK